jgi:DNA-binding Lrp family transcriptional regulator
MMGDWTFFSNYGHVLVCLARNREARLRDVAANVGITERAVQKIVRDMQDAGILTVTKHGRCNRYRINRRKSLRHPLESHCTVGKLLTLIARPVAPEQQQSGAEPAPPVPAATEAEVQEQTPQPEEEKKSPKETKPIDTREQGSLF